MKWLDDKINNVCKKCFDELIKVWDVKISKQQQEIIDLGINLKKSNDSIREVESLLRGLQKDILCVKADIENNVKYLNHKLNEKERLLREDLDLSLTGLSKNLDKKLELLGDKNGIVVSLLKRIAELEGQVEDKNVHG